MCPHDALVRDEVKCLMLQAKRELKLDDKTGPIDDMNVVRPYFRRVDDVKYCIITDVCGIKASDFCDTLQTAVLKSPAHHSGTLQTSSPTPWELRVFTRARSGLPPSETAELRVTSKPPPAMCKAYAKVSLEVSFDGLDVFENMLSVRISSALEQFSVFFQYFTLQQKNALLTSTYFLYFRWRSVTCPVSRSISNNWMSKSKWTSDTFIWKDMSTNTTRCVSVKCPKRMRREVVSQKKKPFHHTNTYSTSKFVSLSLKTYPQEAHMLIFDTPLLSTVIFSFEFLQTLSLIAMFFEVDSERPIRISLSFFLWRIAFAFFHTLSKSHRWLRIDIEFQIFTNLKN